MRENIEHISAKMSAIYPIFSSIYYFELYQIYTILALKLNILIVWYVFEKINYEKIHPWLHIMVAIDAHYYLNCWIELNKNSIM